MKKPEDPAAAETEPGTRPEAETEPSGENGAATPAAAPVKRPDGDGEPASGARTATAGTDEAPARSEEPVKKPEDPAAAQAPPGTRLGAETEPSGEDGTAAPAVAPMKRPDDDIGELVSGAAPATTRKDEASTPGDGPVKKPPKDVAESVPDAEPAAAGKDEAAPAKTAAFRGTGDTPAPRETITIRELLEGTVEFGEDDVFYVHAVTPGDYQGLWGIIQRAVTENFARGVRITLGGRTDTYRVAVPYDADELLGDRSSSRLGLMIHRKSQKTIIYNRRLGRLTQDPAVTLYPGNELVIVGFTPKELIGLYKHFAGADGG